MRRKDEECVRAMRQPSATPQPRAATHGLRDAILAWSGVSDSYSLMARDTYEKSVNIMIVCIFLYFIDEIRQNQRTLTYRPLFLIRFLSLVP